MHGDHCARSHKRKPKEPVDFVSFFNPPRRLLLVPRQFKVRALIANIDLKRKYWLGRFSALSFLLFAASQPQQQREHLFAQETNSTSMRCLQVTRGIFSAETDDASDSDSTLF
jgi:hypothetical protein